jgi:hypothetical protein
MTRRCREQVLDDLRAVGEPDAHLDDGGLFRTFLIEEDAREDSVRVSMVMFTLSTLMLWTGRFVKGKAEGIEAVLVDEDRHIRSQWR